MKFAAGMLVGVCLSACAYLSLKRNPGVDFTWVTDRAPTVVGSVSWDRHVEISTARIPMCAMDHSIWPARDDGTCYVEDIPK